MSAGSCSIRKSSFCIARSASTIASWAWIAASQGNKEGASQYFGEAIKALNRAVSISAENVTPYLDLARTYLQIDQLGTAQQYLDDALLTLQPENPVIHGRLALLYMQRKNYEGALISMKLAVEAACTLRRSRAVKWCRTMSAACNSMRREPRVLLHVRQPVGLLSTV